MDTFTRAQIDSIVVGKTKIGRKMGFGESTPRLVTEIYAKKDDVHGKLFVCGYTQFGDDGTAVLSFSVKEGERIDFNHYVIVNEPETADA